MTVKWAGDATAPQAAAEGNRFSPFSRWWLAGYFSSFLVVSNFLGCLGFGVLIIWSRSLVSDVLFVLGTLAIAAVGLNRVRRWAITSLPRRLVVCGSVMVATWSLYAACLSIMAVSRADAFPVGEGNPPSDVLGLAAAAGGLGILACGAWPLLWVPRSW